jgi:hypothetical protein
MGHATSHKRESFATLSEQMSSTKNLGWSNLVAQNFRSFFSRGDGRKLDPCLFQPKPYTTVSIPFTRYLVDSSIILKHSSTRGGDFLMLGQS